MIVAHVEQIWRYPVKSLGGETVAQARLLRRGLPGDRCWAVVDGAQRQIRSAKQWPALLDHAATLLGASEPREFAYGADVPDALIRLPGGAQWHARDPRTALALGASLGHTLGLLPLALPGDDAHYRLAEARSEAAMAEELQLLPGEAPPDYGGMSPDTMAALASNATPPGTHVDAFPLHLLSTGALAYLRARTGVDAVVQRFRPNLLVRSVDARAAPCEDDWVGRRLAIGEAIVRIDSRTVRCGMPARAQAWCGLAAQPAITRALVELCGRRLGVNVLVEREGQVRTGDALRLLAD